MLLWGGWELSSRPVSGEVGGKIFPGRVPVSGAEKVVVAEIEVFESPSAESANSCRKIVRVGIASTWVNFQGRVEGSNHCDRIPSINWQFRNSEEVELP